MYRDQTPDALDHTEWPCPRKEAVDGGEETAKRKEKNEYGSAILKPVHGHHERQRGHAIEGKGRHGPSLDIRRAEDVKPPCPDVPATRRAPTINRLETPILM